MPNSAKIAWGVAVAAILAAAALYWLLGQQRQYALQQQAQAYEQKLAAQQQAHDEAMAKAQAEFQATLDASTATLEVVQADLDYASQPKLPLTLEFRAADLGRKDKILYAENLTNKEFICNVTLKRSLTGDKKVTVFRIGPSAFQDLAAIDDWLFQPGDEIEFSKNGFQTTKLKVE